jgi:hypothetical protein
MSSAQVALPPASAISLHDSRKSLNSQERSRQWLSQGGSDHRGWKNFHANEQREKQVDIAKYQQSLASKNEVAQPQSKTGGLVTYDVYRDAGQQVEVYHITIHPDGQKTTRRGHSVPMTPNNAAKVKESETQHPDDHPAKIEQTLNGPTQPTSSSRFFPKVTSTQITATTQAPFVPQIAVSDNEAPPPAEQGLFDDAASQPAKVKFPIIAKVNLPGMRQQSVSLPPRSPGLDKAFQVQSAIPAVSQKHVTMPPTLRADDLKAKFGHLHPGGVFANTKPAFDVTVANARSNGIPRVMPTVAVKPLFTVDTSSDVASKPLADDVCFDFPDFGSKPTVRVPTIPHQNHQFGYSHDTSMLAPPRQPRYQKAIETQSISRDEAILFPTEKGDKFGSKVTINLQGMKAAKTVDVHMKRRSGGGPAGVGAAAGGFRKSINVNPSYRRSSNFPPKGSNNKGEGSGAQHRNANKLHKPAGAAGASSSSSSPKPRGHWGPRNSQAGGGGSAN